MVTHTNKTTLPWLLLIVSIGCGAMLFVRENRERQELAGALKDARVRSEDADRQRVRMAEEIRRIRSRDIAQTSPEVIESTEVSAGAKGRPEVAAEPDDVSDATPDLSAALRDVLRGMKKGEDLRIPVRLGTHAAWLPALDGLLNDDKLGIKAWYFEALFAQNDRARVRSLLAKGLRDNPEWESAAGHLVAESATRSAAPLLFVDALLGDENIDVRVGALSGLGSLAKGHITKEQIRVRVMARLDDASERVSKVAASVIRDAKLLAGSDEALTDVLQRVSAADDERLSRLLSLLIGGGQSRVVPALVEAALSRPDLEVALLMVLKRIGADSQVVTTETVAELSAFLAPGVSQNLPGWQAVLSPLMASEDVLASDWSSLLQSGKTKRSWSQALLAPVLGEDPGTVGVFEQRIADASRTGQVDRMTVPVDGVSPRRRAAAMQLFAFADGVDARVRRVAVDALRQAKTHLVLPALLHLLGDTDQQVRLRAAAGLSSHSIDAGITYLTGVVADDGENRYEAMISLLNAQNDAAFVGALRVVETGDTLNIWFLVDDCIQTGRSLPEASIRSMLVSGSIKPWRADSYLGCFETSIGTRVTALLAELLVESKIPLSIQHVVIRWLSESSEPRLAGLLGRFLESDVPTIRAATLHALSRLDGDAVPIQQLLEFTDDDDPFVLTELCYCLASTTNPMATNALVTLSKNNLSVVREVATRMLGGRRHPTVLPALKGRLSEDDDRDVVNASLMSLVKCGDFDHVGTLFQHIEDSWVGPRSLRFLKETMGQDLSERQDWVAWWELHGAKWAEDHRRGK